MRLNSAFYVRLTHFWAQIDWTNTPHLIHAPVGTNLAFLTTKCNWKIYEKSQPLHEKIHTTFVLAPPPPPPAPHTHTHRQTHTLPHPFKGKDLLAPTLLLILKNHRVLENESKWEKMKRSNAAFGTRLYFTFMKKMKLRLYLIELVLI